MRPDPAGGLEKILVPPRDPGDYEGVFESLLAAYVAGDVNKADLVARMRQQAEALEAAVVNRSRQLAEALETVQNLYSTSQEQLERLKAFTEIATRISRHGELGPLLDAVAELAARLIRTPSAFIALVETDGTYRMLPEAGHWGLSDEFVAAFATLPGRGLHAAAFEAKMPVASCDILEDARSANDMVRQEGWRAEMVAPLLVGDRPIGILVAGDRIPRDWTGDDIEIIRFLASQATAAIDRARSLDDLRALDRVKDEILSIASHELRTPLTAIKGFAAILSSDDSDLPAQEARKYARIIDAEADRMIRLVDDMLNVSRLESGRVHLELHPVVVWEVVDHAILSSWGAEAGRIEVDVDESLEVQADHDCLVRILTNLLENARKYSDRGARVGVSAGLRDAAVEIRVWNEGAPFAAGEIDQLFRKFSRLGRHRDSARGAGLGLYIARQLIVAMEGRLWVAQGEIGPTFAFSLPSA